MKLISLIVPVYNEEEMLPIFFSKANEIFKDSETYRYELFIVNDGSNDKTLEIIKEEAKTNGRLSYISFSRNYGQEAAVEAGLKGCHGDIVIPIDCDFQDPPELVFEMLKKYEEGYEVVNAKRKSRDDDTALKKNTAGLFYSITNKIAGKKVIEENVCFFRLMTRRVVDYINSLPEASRVIRAEVPYVGFKTCDVEFARVRREAGKTKYNYKKLMGVAGKTFTAATSNLLSFPFIVGVIGSALSGAGIFITFILGLVFSRKYDPRPFYTNLVFMIIFGIILCVSLIALLLSIHSLYLKNIVANTQNRPNYFIEESFTGKNID